MYKCICGKAFDVKSSFSGHIRSCNQVKIKRRELWDTVLSKQVLYDYFVNKNYTASHIARLHKSEFEQFKISLSAGPIIKQAKKYGIPTKSITEAANNKQTRNLFKQTCLENHGVENPLQNAEIKSKTQDTCLKKYGHSNFGNGKEIREKKKENCRAKHGVDYYFQTDEFVEEQKERCLDKYGKTTYLYSEQYFKDLDNNHGVKHVSQLPGVAAKATATKIERYGHPCPGALVKGYSKAATEYIEQYIKDNNLNKDLCFYANSEYRFSDNSITFNASKTVAYDLTVFNEDGTVNLILEYHGLAYHATEEDYKSNPDRVLAAGRCTVKEAYEKQEHKKSWALKNILENNLEKYIEVFK